MTTAAEMQGKMDEFILDLARLHNFLKGDPSVTIVGESGSYPSLAKWLEDNFDVELLNDLEEAAASAIEASSIVNTYPNSAGTAVPRGVTNIALGSGGSGYTNGTFVGTFSGGGGTGARFMFTVVGGVVTSVYGLEPGYGYTSNPTPVFTASAGGTGATLATVTASHLVLSGEFYWVAQTDGSLRLYQNVSGTATAVSPAVYRPFAALVPGTITASTSILWNFALTAGFAVASGGLVQKFKGLAPGNNGAGTLLMGIPGVFGGVRVPVVTRTLEPVPQNHIKANYPFEVEPATISGVNYLILSDYNPVLPEVRLEWMGALAYNTGTTAITAGQTITGGTSGLTAVVIMVPNHLATGDWGAGTRAGTLFVTMPAPPNTAPAFLAGEDLKVGGVTVAKAGGGVSTSAQLYARIAEPGYIYPTALSGVPLFLQVPATKPFGSPALTVYPYNPDPTTTPIFSGGPIYDSSNVTLVQDAGAWEAWDTLSLKRWATGRVNLMKAPEPNIATLHESVSAATIDIAPKVAPILLHRQTANRWHVARADGIAHDDPANQMNQDVHHALIYNMGQVMSGVAALQNARAWSLNSEWAEIAGQKFAYGMMISDERAAGIFDQVQPSIAEPVGYYGFYGTPFSETFSGGVHDGRSKWSDIGLGHGHLRLVSASVSGEAMANGNGAWATEDVTTLGVGKRKRFRTLTFSAVYDAFIRIQTGYLCIGRFTVEHRFSHLWKGVRLYARYDFGRSLSYTNYGSTVIAPGAVVTGATSGATATVVIIPDTEITSGSIAAGTAAGRMNIMNVTGTFQAGEDLLVSGVARAKAADAQSDPIGVQQNFGFMLLGTTINKAKVAGLAEKATGLEVDAELSPGVPNPLYAVAHGQGSRLQMRHGKTPIDDIIYEEILMDSSWSEAALPVTGGWPAGQGSLSGFWVQDRKEGLRKGYNSIYTGTGQNIFEGTFEFYAQHQFRQGALH